MNHRDYKIFYKGGYFHIYNRGNGKMNIFLDTADFLFFLARLKESLYPELIIPLHGAHQAETGRQGARYVRKQLPSKAYSLISYVLMPNHFHLLIKQNSELPISKLISKVCTSYSKYFNAKYERVGSLFQDQYKAVRVESDSYLLWLSAYIHQNPAVAGLVKVLKEYPYGSYLDYAGLRDGVLCQKDLILGMFKNSLEYLQFVDQSYDKIKERKDLEDLLLD